MKPGETVSAEASTTWAPAGTASPTDLILPSWMTTTARSRTSWATGSRGLAVVTAITGDCCCPCATPHASKTTHARIRIGPSPLERGGSLTRAEAAVVQNVAVTLARWIDRRPARRASPTGGCPRRVLHRLLRGLHDEALRRRADEVEGIAGDERHQASRGRSDHLGIVGTDDGELVHAEATHPAAKRQLQHVPGGDVLQDSEEPVAVAGDSDVARVGRPDGALDVAHAAVQRPLVGALEHRDLEG